MLAPYPVALDVAMCDAPDCNELLLIPHEPPSGALPITVLRRLYRWHMASDGRTFCREHTTAEIIDDDDDWWSNLRDEQLANAEPLPWDSEISIPLPPLDSSHRTRRSTR